jgi:hypothetical protein
VTSNKISLAFADGEYDFFLPLPQIAELQRKCNVGIGGLYARTIKGAQIIHGEVVLLPGSAEFYAADLIETIRHGLIGGAKGVVNGETVEVTPVLAGRLIETYVLNQPLKSAWDLAVSILGVCIMGYDPPKKDEPAEQRAEEQVEATDSSTTIAP